MEKFESRNASGDFLENGTDAGQFASDWERSGFLAGGGAAALIQLKQSRFFLRLPADKFRAVWMGMREVCQEKQDLDIHF